MRYFGRFSNTRAGSVNRKYRLTDRKSQKPNRTETENDRFSKTEPNRKPNSLTAVTRKGIFLKFLGEISEKIRENFTISADIVEISMKP